MKRKNLLAVLASSAIVLSGCSFQDFLDFFKKNKKDDETPTTESFDVPLFERPTYEKFNGALNLAGDDEAYRYTLGAMERWGIEHFVTGLTLYDNTSYVMYHPSVQKGTQTYVPAYGFGIQREGNITYDLEGESNAAFKQYYHSVLAADPKTLKYMDSKENTVGTLAGNMAATLWTTHLNAAKDDYEWSPELALSENPVLLKADGTVDETGTKGKQYRIEVKVGNDWKYNTNSEKPAIAAYNGRGIELEDYITPYKIYYTKGFGLQRSAENLTGSGSFAGTEAYYNASEAGFNETAWASVGISCEEKEGHNYLYFTFNKDTTIDDARSYLSSSMFNPVPMSFVKDVLGGGDLAAGVKLWGNYSTDYTSYTPLDTSLSTGPYSPERWDKDQLITFKRNPFYPQTDRIVDELDNVTNRPIYQIPGLHYNILPAVSSDPNAAFKEFLANKIHSCSIPGDYLTEYLSDERTTVVEGDTTYRLNLNTCTQEFWDYNFGPDGVAYQNASDRWECEPIMSNYWFDRGISYAVDRITLAGSVGNSPFYSFLSNEYTLGEGGDIWNHTEEHAAATESLTTGTDGFGYNLEFAKQCFKKASEEMVAAGAYKAGDTIKIEVRWYSSSQFEKEGAPLKQMLEKAFNECGGPLKLEIENTADDSDPYSVFDYIESGHFDIAIGAISGMQWWPLEFLETLKSNNSSGYTLGFGVDTNVCDGTLAIPLSLDEESGEWYFDAEEGTMYSFAFDALFSAATQGAFIVNGVEAICPWEFVGSSPITKTGDVYQMSFAFEVDEESEFSCELAGVVFYYYDGEQNYCEIVADSEVTKDDETGYTIVTVQVGPEDYGDVLPLWLLLGPGYASYTGFDLYLDWFKGGERIVTGKFFGTVGYFDPADFLD